MAKLIAGSLQKTPPVVFRLLRMAIELRLSCNLQFERLAEATSDEEVKASNRSHKHFINVLRETFEILGGKKWEQEEKPTKVFGDTNEASAQTIMSNMFSLLTLQGANDSDSCSEAEELHTPLTSPSSKRSKKSNKNKHRQLSVDKYRLLDDAMDKIQAEYVKAATNITEQAIDLRLRVQKIWGDVAYLSAWSLSAAGASAQAAAIVKKAQDVVFYSFPDDDAYIKLIQAYTGGGIDKLPEDTTIRLSVENYEENPFDYELQEYSVPHEHMKELLMLHTYNDLVEFSKDYKQAPVGKPTELLSKQFAKWEFDTDIAKLRPKKRKTWRRLYTIKWLYALLDSFYTYEKHVAHLEHERAAEGGQPTPVTKKTSFFLMNDFVADLVKLVAQETEVVKKGVSFHLLFQLQCMVDSFTISRGWEVGFSSSVFYTPAPSLKHSTTARNLEQFLCSGDGAAPRGIVSGVNSLKDTFDIPPFAFMFQRVFINRMRQDIMGHYLVVSSWLKLLVGAENEEDLEILQGSKAETWSLSPSMCGSTLMEAVKRNFAYAMMV